METRRAIAGGREEGGRGREMRRRRVR